MPRSFSFVETVEHHGVTLVISAARGRERHVGWVRGPQGKMPFAIARNRHYPFGPALRNRAVELYCGGAIKDEYVAEAIRNLSKAESWNQESQRDLFSSEAT